MASKLDLAQWVEESLESIGMDVEGCVEPYSPQHLIILREYCPQIKLLYDFLNRFDITIKTEIYDKYKGFSLIST